MKKLFSVMMLLALCFGAKAQEEEVNEFLNKQSFFGHTSFFYNYNMGAPEGMSPHGWGIELSTLYIGFKPWENGYLTLGLLDVSVDMNYLKKGWMFTENLTGTAITPTTIAEALKPAYSNLKAGQDIVTFQFPLGYVHTFGDSKWKAAVFAAPGIGMNEYHNEYAYGYVRHNEELSLEKSSYFRLNLEAFVWYNSIGIAARYGFPVGFHGPGILSFGLSFGI